MNRFSYQQKWMKRLHLWDLYGGYARNKQIISNTYALIIIILCHVYWSHGIGPLNNAIINEWL